MRLSSLTLLLPLVVAPSIAAQACSSTPAKSDAGLQLSDATRPDTSAAPLPTALASDLVEPRGIAVIGDTLYVAEHGGGRIVSMPRAGGAVQALVTGRSGPYRIATDGQVLVVTEREGGDVVEIATGGALTVLASGIDSPSELSVRDGTAYFTSTPSDGGLGSVWSVALAAGSPWKLVDGVDRPAGISVGEQFVYFAGNAVQGATGNVFTTSRWPSDAGPLDGSTDASSAQVLIATPYVGYAAEADEDAGQIYWGVVKGSGAGGGEAWIEQTSLADAATSTMIAIAPGGCVDRVRLLPGFVHFKTCSTLMRVATDGGPQQDLATNTYAGDFVVADATLYWTDVTAGRVYALPLPP